MMIKKTTSRVMCIFVALAVMTAAFCQFGVSAATTGENLSTAVLDPYKSYVSGTKFPDELKNHIETSLRQMESRIDIAKYSLNTDETSAVYSEVLYGNPDLFYVNAGSYSYSINSSSVVTSISPKYLYTPDETAQRSAIFDASVRDIINGMPLNLTDEQKLLYFHDELAIDCQYATDELNNGGFYSHPEIYNAYGALVNKRAVCQGYSLAYNYLASKMGIDASLVISNAMNHAWSMVKLGSEYYHVDVTWDDPTYDILGRVTHNYFLKSDSYMLSDSSGSRHYDWTFENAADDTTYDDSFWNNINSKIYYRNGKYYYCSNLASSGNCGKIMTYDGSNYEVLLDLNCRWYVSGNSGYFWSNTFSGFVINGDTMYFNTPTQICSAKLDGSNKTVLYTLSDAEQKTGNIYGMVLDDDGYFNISQAESPSVKMTNSVVPSTKIDIVPLYTEIIGDVDFDGKITVLDVTLLQMHQAKILTLTDQQILNGDVDFDGNINVMDIGLIQMICARLIEPPTR